jgi:hypothetical protein
MLGPNAPHLLIGRKFATRGGGFRDGDGRALFGGKRHGRCLIIRTGKPEHNAGDVVLSVRRKDARRFKRLFEKSGHGPILTRKL